MAAETSLQRFLNFYQQWYAPEQLSRLSVVTGKALVFPVESEKGKGESGKWSALEWFVQARWVGAGDLASIDKNSSGYYVMDAASLLSVLALDPQPGESVADLCAAPGGKTIAIAALMKGRGRLLASDLSADRVKRLRYNLRRLQVPESANGWTLDTIHASGNVVSQQFSGQFDKVLVDAPCSSEAHVMADPKELKKWSGSKSSLLAKRQRKLIQSAIKLLKPGGRLVYATCSISPLENQGVIEFMLKKFSQQLQYVPWQSPVGTALGYGVSVLPWDGGMGPGYLCVLEKRHDKIA